MGTKQIGVQLVGALLLALVVLALGTMKGPTIPVAAQGTPTPIPVLTPACAVTPYFSDGFESGTPGAFVSVVDTCVPGGCGWSAATSASHIGTYSAFSPDVNNVADQQLRLANALPIPATGLISATLTFWHRFRFEGSANNYYDGGVLESSIDGGTTWQSPQANITSGGYNGFISTAYGNPLAARAAWGQVSPGFPAFIQVRVNLLPYAGKNLLFRFRQGDDSSISSDGWWVDDVLVTFASATCTRYLPLIERSNAGATGQSAPGFTAIEQSTARHDTTSAGSQYDFLLTLLRQIASWFGRE